MAIGSLEGRSVASKNSEVTKQLQTGMFEDEEEEEEENENKRYRDEPLHTEKIFSDRKTFFIDLKANNRGKFLKITEDVRGRRDTIMLPAETLEEFIDALQNVSDVLGSDDSETSED
ncbi:MAG: hypothetical protein GY899_02260 [Verrucomicrobiaceae bacterium]|nr:hypothetical protein [Verrucomicrobiaceae bacterium]